MPPYKVLTAGDTALIIEFGDRVDRELSAWVLALARHLNEARIAGVIETVPTFRSLMVYFDPIALPAAQLIAQIEALMEGVEPTSATGRQWRLPVCYDGDLAPDLNEVATRTGLTRAGVIERHAGVTYHVYMLGFLPGLAYLGDVASDLMLPRRDMPRTRIPAGSVGIGMAMTCIFPRESPCGLHLLGHSPVPLWRLQNGEGTVALLTPGDQVVFLPVSRREHEALLAAAAAGDLVVTPVDTAKDAA
jgi:KipI family sensor histidine kinase inhibitor